MGDRIHPYQGRANPVYAPADPGSHFVHAVQHSVLSLCGICRTRKDPSVLDAGMVQCTIPSEQPAVLGPRRTPVRSQAKQTIIRPDQLGRHTRQIRRLLPGFPRCEIYGHDEHALCCSCLHGDIISFHCSHTKRTRPNGTSCAAATPSGIRGTISPRVRTGRCADPGLYQKHLHQEYSADIHAGLRLPAVDQLRFLLGGQTEEP